MEKIISYQYRKLADGLKGRKAKKKKKIGDVNIVNFNAGNLQC